MALGVLKIRSQAALYNSARQKITKSSPQKTVHEIVIKTTANNESILRLRKFMKIPHRSHVIYV